MAIIDLKQVSKVYGFGDATTIAVDATDLKIEKGDFVAIMGPSGSGKSSLLHIIGLLDRPSTGQYKLDNRNVSRFRSGKRAKTRRDKIGFVFQNFNLLSNMTALENVSLPLAYKGKSTLRRLNQSSVMLAKVGLQSREYYYPHQLSGGQVQRVAIARALINNPAIIIADEPTGNLDSASSKVIMELLKDIHKGGNTILMVTHNPEITVYANRVLYMLDGKIVIDQPLKKGEKANLENLQKVQQKEDNHKKKDA
ncbi:MAG TPA: ABC transporter ATP-binding protein [Candidatus Saccharibacteria bacterium]|nr:ABC transporter ATP-binding protein [Candidatus Saccharibacteria bacterium]